MAVTVLQILVVFFWSRSVLKVTSVALVILLCPPGPLQPRATRAALTAPNQAELPFQCCWLLSARTPSVGC